MTNLKGIPAQDDFETTLSATYNGGVGSMGVFHVPDSTLPAGEYTYAVIEPGTQNMQVVKISGWTSSPKALIVSDIAVERASGVNYVAKTHPANSIVRVSNNYQFWKDIQDAVNSKADPSIVGDYSFSGNQVSVIGDNVELVTNSDNMTISTNGNMRFQDKNIGPITLNQMIRPATGGSAIEVMSETDWADVDTPELNTAYMRYETGDDVIRNMYFDGRDYKVGNKDIHDLTEKSILSLNDETVVADSESAWGNKKVKLGNILKSLSYIDESNVAGENLSAGDAILKNPSNQWVKATISNQGNIPKQAYIVRKATTSGQPVEYDFMGITDGLSGLTNGSKYFISNTAGVLTTSQNGGFLVGTAVSTDKLLLHNSYTAIIAGDTITLASYPYTYQADGLNYVEKGSFTAGDDMVIKIYGTIYIQTSGIAYFIGKINGSEIFSDDNNVVGEKEYEHEVTLTKGQVLSWGTRLLSGTTVGIKNIYLKCDIVQKYT